MLLINCVTNTKHIENVQQGMWVTLGKHYNVDITIKAECSKNKAKFMHIGSLIAQSDRSTILSLSHVNSIRDYSQNTTCVGEEKL